MCGHEEGFDYESKLCSDPAVIVIDRREQGKMFVCKRHMSQALYEQTQVQRWFWYVIEPTGHLTLGKTVKTPEFDEIPGNMAEKSDKR